LGENVKDLNIRYLDWMFARRNLALLTGLKSISQECTVVADEVYLMIFVDIASFFVQFCPAVV
jgi:hypothetical protein